MPTSPADLDLGRGDPRIAGADDPVHRRQTGLRKPVCESADGLCPAGDDEAVDVEQAGGGEEDRVRAAIAVGRRGDDDPLDPGNMCRDDGHHQRRRVGRGAARDVGADAGKRSPAPLDLDA